MKFHILLVSILILFFCISCNEDDSCTDCGGGLEEGYLYKTVTEDDISKLGQLGITLDECIQFKFVSDTGEELDIETVAVVDDCCCDLYEF